MDVITFKYGVKPGQKVKLEHNAYILLNKCNVIVLEKPLILALIRFAFFTLQQLVFGAITY